RKRELQRACQQHAPVAENGQRLVVGEHRDLHLEAADRGRDGEVGGGEGNPGRLARSSGLNGEQGQQENERQDERETLHMRPPSRLVRKTSHSDQLASTVTAPTLIGAAFTPSWFAQRQAASTRRMAFK